MQFCLRLDGHLLLVTCCGFLSLNLRNVAALAFEPLILIHMRIHTHTHTLQPSGISSSGLLMENQ